jgi:hypothetical protein
VHHPYSYLFESYFSHDLRFIHYDLIPKKNFSYKTGRLLSALGLPIRIQAKGAARMVSVRLAGILAEVR